MNFKCIIQIIFIALIVCTLPLSACFFGDDEDGFNAQVYDEEHTYEQRIRLLEVGLLRSLRFCLQRFFQSNENSVQSSDSGYDADNDDDDDELHAEELRIKRGFLGDLLYQER